MSETGTTHHLPVDRRLPLMGGDVRILVGPPVAAGVAAPSQAADAVEALLRRYDATLSRFQPGSELSRLNADPRETLEASELLRAAVKAALEAAELSGGLVDPALLDGVEAAGYRGSFQPARRLDLRRALREVSSARRPARPDPRARWRLISVDDQAQTITRPVGLRLDTGGTGKGHAADLAAELLNGYAYWLVDVGGDVRVGGDGRSSRSVAVAHPFTGETVDALAIGEGAVATSGLRARIWRGPTGEIAHHLIDPSIGRPVLTGLIAVTALAPTAVRAEALAMAALLSGPESIARVLGRHGGIAFDDAGHEHRFGPLARPSRIPLAVGV